VDALTTPDVVTLRATDSVYPSSGQLITAARDCGVTGNGRVSVKADYSPGETSISLVETATSDDLSTWTEWQAVGANGELESPAKKYIKYRVTLSTTNTARTPTLTSISLYDNPKPLYTKLGYARPVILDSDGNVEAVLDNAYDIIVTSEINGVDELEFKLPFQDSKRAYIDNEKTVRIVSDTYRIRTITDDKEESGKAITTVYAEAAFYDLAYSVKKDEITFNADTADVPMAYALQGTDWDVGTVNVSTKRTWTCSEKNALAILRAVQNIHGGDLIFDNANRIVKLLTFSGEDSGVLFCYKKNMKSIQRVIDTTSLITRLYAYGKDGMTFASINGGNEYVDALKNTSSDDSLRRIQEIQTLLAQNTEKRETLTKLMTQGIIDPILFNKETNELLSQADSFRDEINALKNAVSGDVTKVTAATALLRFAEKGGILQEFDDDLFKEYVNRIIVRSRNEVRFELKCGLALKERM
jgi:phage minor structural protein